ncbi:MAG: hypothetical protein JOZ18_17170 [Chloroflexi bacterium]|nr:hypothetical protein [Chloroflexota bacterium]
MATLGALLVSRDKTWTFRDIISYACTGMASTLLALGLLKVVWQISHVPSLPPLQLITMLLIASIGAAVGTNPMIGDYIMFGASWILARARWSSMVAGGLVGGILGYLLTVGSALSWFTPLGVLLGIGVAIALMWRVDFLMKQTQP